MTVIINPGSGDASQYSDAPPTLANAWAAMGAFARDVTEQHGVPVRQITATVPLDGDGGRWSFGMEMDDGRHIEVDMPGLPIERVRWMDETGQNIWHFPRLYIDGSSWVWKYAVNVCEPTSDEDDEGEQDDEALNLEAKDRNEQVWAAELTGPDQDDGA